MTESEFQTFEAVGALVVVLDVDGRIVYWNRRCSDLTGYSLEEVRGRQLWDFALLPEEIEPIKAVFATLLTAELPSPYANYWVTKTGQRRWIAWSHTLTRHPDGQSPIHHQDWDRPNRDVSEPRMPVGPMKPSWPLSPSKMRASTTTLDVAPTNFSRQTSTWSERRSRRKS